MNILQSCHCTHRYCVCAAPRLSAPAPAPLLAPALAPLLAPAPGEVVFTDVDSALHSSSHPACPSPPHYALCTPLPCPALLHCTSQDPPTTHPIQLQHARQQLIPFNSSTPPRASSLTHEQKLSHLFLPAAPAAPAPAPTAPAPGPELVPGEHLSQPHTFTVSQPHKPPHALASLPHSLRVGLQCWSQVWASSLHSFGAEAGYLPMRLSSAGRVVVTL